MILPALSAVLLTLSLPPFSLAGLAPIAAAPFAFHLARLPPDSGGTRGAALAGVVFGGVHALLLLHWIPGAALPLLGMAGALTAGPAVWGVHAAFTGVAAAAVHRTSSRGWLAPPVALAAAWITLGWVPAAVPLLGFPWLGPEAALVEVPRFLGISDLGGGGAVTGVLFLFAGAAGWFAASPGKRTSLWLIGSAMILLGAAGYGIVGEARSERGVAARSEGGRSGMKSGGPRSEGTFRAAIVSVEAGPGLLADPERRLGLLEHDVALGSRALAGKQLELVLWPESLTGSPGWKEGGAGLPPEVPVAERWADELGVPVVLGVIEAVSEAPDGAHGAVLSNRVVRIRPPGIGPAGAELLHEKVRLVPGVERRWGGGVDTGGRLPPFELENGISAGALICFEALYAAEGTRLRRAGARVLFVLSNEGWLTGRGAGVADAAVSQHRAASVLRAVELRVPVLRSSVGGSAEAWGSDGLPVNGERFGDDVAGVFLASVAPGADRAPFFARGGGIALHVAALIVLLAGAVPARRRSGRAWTPERARTGRVAHSTSCG